MLHEDLTEKILSCCFDVINELGAGFLESVYEESLIVALQEKSLHAKRQEPINVKFRGKIVGEFYADILVENKVIIELKAAKAINNEHKAQLINYLKATGVEVGLLVNFGRPTLGYMRLYKENKQDHTR